MVLMIKTVGATNRAGGAPSWNGIALVQANSTQKAAASPEASAELWYLLNPPNGAGTVTIPNSNAATIFYQVAFGKSVTLRSKFNAASGGNATSTNPTPGAIASALAGDIVFAITAGGWTTWAPSAQAGTAISNDDDGANGGGTQYSIRGADGSFTLSWTFGTSDDWGAVAAAFSEEPNPGPSAFYRAVGPALPFQSAPRNAFLAPTIVGGISVDPGSITLAGQTVVLELGIAQDAGAITAAGQAVTFDLTVGRSVGFVNRNVGPALPFQAAIRGYVIAPVQSLALDAGAITVEGQSIVLAHGLAVSNGAVTLAGQSVAVGGYTLTPDPGAITLAGQASTAATNLALSAGAITVAGQTVTLSAYNLPIGDGAITLAGQSVGFSTNAALDAGGISVDGKVVSLSSGQLNLSYSGFVNRNVGPALPFAPKIGAYTPLVLTGFTIDQPGSVMLQGGDDLALGFTAVRVAKINRDFGPYFEFTPKVRSYVVSVPPISVSVDPGSVTVAGQAMTLGLSLAQGTGAATIAGQSATMAESLALGAGSISVVGQLIALSNSGNLSLAIDAGGIAVAGQPATLKFQMNSGAGAAAVAGQAIGFGYGLSTADGAIGLSGGDLALTVSGNRTLSVDPGQIVLVGQSMKLSSVAPSLLTVDSIYIAPQFEVSSIDIQPELTATAVRVEALS